MYCFVSLIKKGSLQTALCYGNFGDLFFILNRQLLNTFWLLLIVSSSLLTQSVPLSHTRLLLDCLVLSSLGYKPAATQPNSSLSRHGQDNY